VGVVDTWGYGFVDELDYIEEAVNAKSFTEGIEQTPLSGVVFAPPIVDELTTRKVLTTEWVVGERLDKSGKEDVSILCSIAMNSYLTMMLETGLLHCDPHVSCIRCLCVREQKILLGVLCHPSHH
jgi:predicted unusual protein kinase regulating ubiquinone biosynthesis (AarF/ABC1/UbiB family)